MTRVIVRPCADSDERAEGMRRLLDLPRRRALELGHSAVAWVRAGEYAGPGGHVVSIRAAVTAARRAKASLPLEAPLPDAAAPAFEELAIEVANETTLQAARRLVEAGQRPLALNFANGVNPGGGFLLGARAQEEVLCRSSALHATLEGDAMYAAHKSRADFASSDWAILSPDVPVFRCDDGKELDAPWLLSIVTCAAPVAFRVGQPAAGDLLQHRLRRLLAIAAAHRYEALVLGAWGCGAFGNDPVRTARDFREALLGPFLGRFREVVFAISDWSPERRFLGPFRDAFGGVNV